MSLWLVFLLRYHSADTVLAHPEGHGFDDTLPKPFTRANLDAVLSRVLAKRR